MIEWLATKPSPFFHLHYIIWSSEGSECKTSGKITTEWQGESNLVQSSTDWSVHCHPAE